MQERSEAERRAITVPAAGFDESFYSIFVKQPMFWFYFVLGTFKLKDFDLGVLNCKGDFTPANFDVGEVELGEFNLGDFTLVDFGVREFGGGFNLGDFNLRDFGVGGFNLEEFDM